MHWHRIWNPETTADWAASAALLPLSWLYGLGWRSYAAVYQLGFKKRRRFEIPILGIGNLEVGGSGKTPVTIALAELLASTADLPRSKSSFAISASAYGSPSSQGATLVPVGVEMTPERHGDEPCLLRSKLPDVPLILGRDRVMAAEIATENGFRALLLDDGFQHLPLGRRADIVLWDTRRKNRRLLPAGPMREPVGGLSRASALFFQAGNCGDGPEMPRGLRGFCYKRLFPGFINVRTGERKGWEWASGRQATALCAIARPEGFFQTLRDGGVDLKDSLVLPDHDPLASVKMDPSKTWFVTEKDAVKLSGGPELPFETYALEMVIEFCDEEAVAEWLKQTLFP